ncbi:MAG: NAD(+)/NADH kinase [Clostridia bacterium]|nr:NAD(+)/NADH kinase [Clostridia bacterium]
MKKIGVIANRDKDIQLKYTRILVESILKYQGEAFLTKDISNEISMGSPLESEEQVMDAAEIIICLGGDGTFLKAARKAYVKNKPILGINLGSLGFLTEIDKNDIESAVKHVIDNEYELEERMMLDTSIIRKGSVIARDVALNDVVISRGALSRILHVKAYINSTLVDLFPGDGLIVSSPSGSTAYSLAAGGPIVEPDIDLIILTPICPHILFSRSCVTTGDRVIRAVIHEENCHDAMVTIDGQQGYEVQGSDIIEIKKSSHRVKVVRINERDFFNVLRTKIYERGEKLKKNEI